MSKFPTLRHLKSFVPIGLIALTAAILLAPVPANATPYVIKLVQQGSNVVATGSGSFDLTGLTSYGSSFGSGAGLWASIGFMNPGASTSVTLDGYSGFTGPASFGSGGSISATSSAGDYTSIVGDPNYYGVAVLWLPSGYISGTALSDSATWDAATFTSLGVTPGTYVWTWGSGADQSFTLIIGNAVGVPEPAALGMFGLGVLLIGAFVGLRRRVA